MKEKQSFNFFIGLIIGTLVCLIIWYWQKSTRAEDGAFVLLDRLQKAESKIRRLQMAQTAGETAVSVPTASSDDLQQIKGIGPVFAERLVAGGIKTFAALAGLTGEHLAEILQIHPGRAARILAEL